MKIPAAVLADIDYLQAVKDELFARNRFLPPPLASWALRGKSEELADRLESRMRRDFEPSPHHTVLARKAGRGSRPLPYIALNDRFAYRALVNALPGHLSARSREGYATFATGPMEVEGCRYVLKADIAAFYQYVDHERLIDEVVAQTGDDLVITAVVNLLESGTGRRFGLPQMHAPSDVLGDLYVDPIRRSLVRKGHKTFRYADDFRVSCASYSEALAVLETIEREALELGLVLNEAKTSSPKLSTYVESLSEIDRAERELFATLETEGMSIEDFFSSLGDLYDDDEEGFAEVSDDISLPKLPGIGHDEADPPQEAPDEGEPTTEQVEVAARVMQLWDQEDNSVEWSPLVWSTLVRKSLLTLEIARDARAVEESIALLVREPHLTPQVCDYLIAIGSQEPKQVHTVLDELCSSDIVSTWQSLWVAYLVGSVKGSKSGSLHMEWLQRQVENPNHAVMTQAALAMARRGALSADVGARVYDRSPDAHRPTAALALAAAHGRVGTEFAYDDEVESWLAEWAATQRWGQRSTKRVARRKKAK